MSNFTEVPTFEGPQCPLPLTHAERIVLGHGSGGRMTHDLIRTVFRAYLGNPYLNAGNDFARLPLPLQGQEVGHLAVSTDTHVISPLFFPGGDIGRLAVCGTVNDISMSGAIPLYLTAGFVLEEGLSLEVLERIVRSMQSAAEEAGVTLVAGDTKVVEKGKGDGVFINTTGIGWIPPDRSPLGGERAQPGDVVLLSGPIGDHGIAVLSARGELGFEAEVQSDVAPLNHLIQALLQAAPHTHVLRDPTRGGLATTLNEIAQQSQVAIRIDEATIPIRPVVRAACEMLGLDPLYIANEGKVVAIVPPGEAEAALAAMRQAPYGAESVRIGYVENQPTGRVILRTILGTHHILDILSGEMLPRIC
ncbi:hydrogenase expression/formation protein HypE [uncultured Thermanaerothrix sp.]|uniref:hydrogenase expression/formation protein HypE n=1 Tax=uncultured Thermanaerothrix sp. TaxID=1195149 RepID=UPI0026049AAD|nr:hydrogenase expression/formation protein HypE [uncultured Thermanaerothrix sp.]